MVKHDTLFGEERKWTGKLERDQIQKTKTTTTKYHESERIFVLQQP